MTEGFATVSQRKAVGRKGREWQGNKMVKQSRSTEKEKGERGNNKSRCARKVERHLRGGDKKLLG